MTSRYTIGGMSFEVADTVAGLPTGTFSDIDLTAEFVSVEHFRSTVAPNHEVIPGPGGLEGAIDPAKLRCWLPGQATPEDRGWYLRQMAPVFSAVLDRLVLHASAVRIGGSVHAIVGASGAGKSTTVRSFAERGYPVVADDLLPIRFVPDPIVPTVQHDLPIGPILFLERTETDEVAAKPLDSATALRRLIAHGFGEHGNRSAWAFQFDAYHQIAEAAPAFDLVVPDDLAALPRVVDAIVELAHPANTDESPDAD